MVMASLGRRFRRWRYHYHQQQDGRRAMWSLLGLAVLAVAVVAMVVLTVHRTS